MPGTEFSNLTLRKTFADVMVEEEMWEWIRGPFMNGVYVAPAVARGFRFARCPDARLALCLLWFLCAATTTTCGTIVL